MYPMFTFLRQNSKLLQIPNPVEVGITTNVFPTLSAPTLQILEGFRLGVLQALATSLLL